MRGTSKVLLWPLTGFGTKSRDHAGAPSVNNRYNNCQKWDSNTHPPKYSLLQSQNIYMYLESGALDSSVTKYKQHVPG